MPLITTPRIMNSCTLHLCTTMHPCACTPSAPLSTPPAHQVLVEGKRPNLVPPMRPLTDLRKLLLTVKRSLPMSPEVKEALLAAVRDPEGEDAHGFDPALIFR